MREVFTPEMPDEWMDDRLTPKRWRWFEPACYSFPRRWRLLRAATLTPAERDLFDGLVEHLGWENRVTDSLARLARDVGISPATATRSLARLERARLVAVDRSMPTRPIITVSPFVVWQGRPHHVYYARRVFNERCDRRQRDRQAAQQHDEDNAALAAVVSLPCPG